MRYPHSYVYIITLHDLTCRVFTIKKNCVESNQLCKRDYHGLSLTVCLTDMKWVTFRHMYLGDFPSTEDWHLVLELQFYVMLCVSTSGEDFCCDRRCFLLPEYFQCPKWRLLIVIIIIFYNFILLLNA